MVTDILIIKGKGYVMNEVFDLVAAIVERANEFSDRTGVSASSISLSPSSYRRLLEINARQTAIGNLIIGCVPINEIEVPAARLRVVIDEMLADTDVLIA